MHFESLYEMEIFKLKFTWLCQNCTHNRICSTLMSLSEAPPCAFCVSWRRRSYLSPWCPPSDSVWSTDTPTSDATLCWPSTLYTGTYPAQHNGLAIYTIYRYKPSSEKCAGHLHYIQVQTQLSTMCTVLLSKMCCPSTVYTGTQITQHNVLTLYTVHNQLSTLLVIFTVYRSDFSAMHTLYAYVNEWYVSAEKSVTLRS